MSSLVTKEEYETTYQEQSQTVKNLLHYLFQESHDKSRSLYELTTLQTRVGPRYTLEMTFTISSDSNKWIDIRCETICERKVLVPELIKVTIPPTFLFLDQNGVVSESLIADFMFNRMNEWIRLTPLNYLQIKEPIIGRYVSTYLSKKKLQKEQYYDFILRSYIRLKERVYTYESAFRD